MTNVKGPSFPKVPARPQNARPQPKAKNTRRGRYQRPMPTETEEEERIGSARHHEADVEEERRRHAAGEGEGEAARANEADEEDDYEVQGLNWDDERKKKGRQPPDEEEEDEDGEAAAEAAKSAKQRGYVTSDGAGRYFQDMPEDRMGDLSLRDPNEMKRILGPSARFAQHAMLLAQARMDDGMSRVEAIQYLASLYEGVGDRSYARKALKEFGPATGILDVYPLEVVEHLLQFVPSFFTNVSRGRFLTSAPSSRYAAKAGETIYLSYPPELKIRGFAIKGGERPGYLLEPTDPKGTYALTFQSAGSFHVLISAISRGGGILIEEMHCEIEAGDDTAFDDRTAIKRERAAEEAAPTEKGERRNIDEDLRIHLKQRI